MANAIFDTLVFAAEWTAAEAAKLTKRVRDLSNLVNGNIAIANLNSELLVKQFTGPPSGLSYPVKARPIAVILAGLTYVPTNDPTTGVGAFSWAPASDVQGNQRISIEFATPGAISAGQGPYRLSLLVMYS